MKKLLAILLAAVMIFSLSACGGDDEKTPPADGNISADAGIEENSDDPVQLSGFAGTKTGRFYSGFTGGRMYMEYEMNLDGHTLSVITATDGERTYSETKTDGISAGVSIMDGEDMYTIDHSGKMIIRMSLGSDAKSIAGAVLEESDVNMDEYRTGNREIDGVLYDTEEWIVDGYSFVMCFDGDEPACMITSSDGKEMIMKIIRISGEVDDSLFEIPGDYTVFEM